MLSAAGRAAFGQAPPPMPPMPGQPAASFPPPPVKGGPPGVAAVVNGQAISKAQVMRAATASPYYERALQSGLQQVIANAMVDQQAKKEGVTVTPAQIAASVAQLRQRLTTQPGSPSLEKLLASQHSTMTDLQENLRVKLEAEALVRKGQKVVHSAHIHYIVVLTANPSGDPTKKPHTDAEAQDIIAKAQADLKAGKTFEAVAATYTEDTGKSNGGDIGIVSTDSPLDPAFVQAALALKPGQVTATPVHSTQFGYFLLKCVSTSEQPGPDRALYDQANQQNSSQQVQAYFQTLLKTAKITNYFTP